MEFRTSVVRSFVVVLFLYLQYYSTYKSIVHVQHRSKKKVDHGDKMGHGPKKGHAPREKCGTFIHRHLQATLQGAKNTPVVSKQIHLPPDRVSRGHLYLYIFTEMMPCTYRGYYQLPSTC